MSAVVYEEVALAEMTYKDEEQMYYYECPCGDKFEIALEDLYDGEDIAPCPSCTLLIKVIFKEDMTSWWWKPSLCPFKVHGIGHESTREDVPEEIASWTTTERHADYSNTSVAFP